MGRLRPPHTHPLMADDLSSSAHRDHEALSRHPRERPRRLRSRQGRGARPPGRERGRQVDAHEHPLRALPRRRGRDPSQRETPSHRLPERRDQSRDRDGAPALHVDSGHDGRREHRPRGRASQRPVSRPRSRGATCTRPLPALWAHRRPDGPGRADQRRPAATRRDPEGALSRRRDPHPRRAHRRAHAAGGERALRRHPLAHRAGEVDHLHQPQAQRGAGDRRPDHRPSSGKARRHRAARRARRRRALPA